MITPPRIASRLAAGIVAVALTAAGLIAATGAAADTLPPLPSTPVTVASDALPAPQIDGVAWSQVVVGNTVYVAGKFTTARPAGAAAGTNTVARSNILAYDIETGVLNSSFAPNLNGQALAITASPDGSRLYVAGDFTSVNGVAYYRIAAFSTATGQVIPSFKPILGSQGRALTASNSTVYVGGTFRTVSGQPRDYLASINASNGAVNAWAPNTDAVVDALALTTDGSKVVVGGRFTVLAGAAFRGLGAVDASTGASLPWAANSIVRNAGTEASITSLRATPDAVYGTGYVFGDGGNLEGTFSADPSTGAITWIEDCHGDTYSSFSLGDAVYVASHSHYCGAIGGFPQTDPWTMHYGLAFSKAATGINNGQSLGYWNFGGTPSPTLLDWFPTLTPGTYTGQGQAGWSVTGNSKYVVYGGEFTHVNGVAQQGLVRFAIASAAPNKEAPIVTTALVPTVASFTPGQVRLAWTTTWDHDNSMLTYKLVRDGQTATPIYTETKYSNFYTLSRMGFVDTGLVPGSTHTYRLYVSDGYGNTISRLAPTATVATTDSSGAYDDAVTADSPTYYWPLDEASGANAYDHAGFDDLTLGSGATRGDSGILAGSASTAFSGASTAFAPSPVPESGPTTYTVEAWFKTTSTSGGKIVGFGASSTGTSSSYDRHVYMDNTGRIWFGNYPGGVRTVNSTASYNDGAWHQVAASLSASGMSLFVDGKLVGTRSDTTSAQDYLGFWRVGGDNLGGWPSQPASNYFAGSIAQVAVYPQALSRNQIVSHYVASGRPSPLPAAPPDPYGNAVFAADPLAYYRLNEVSGSTAADSGPNQNDGVYSGTVVRSQAGAVAGTGNASAKFTSGSGVATQSQFSNPTTYSLETWFKTSTNQGGKLIGFGNAQSGLSSNYDRHVYMRDDGRLVFGTWTGQTNTITSPDAYNDGGWHHVVATQSSGGMKLFVDGDLVGTNPQTAAQDYTGYWKAGGDTTWGSSSPYFDGLLDEIAIYGGALDASTITQHYSLGAGVAPPNQLPVASFTAAPGQLTASFDATASSDPDGTIAGYAWTFGDGGTGSGVNPTHPYSVGGNYTVTLTVTDNSGATASTSTAITVASAPPPNQAPVASFTAAPGQLTASFNASASNDPDGTIAGYAWTFGDGGTGSGVNPTHPYAAGGNYTVGLTVTDNVGATATTSKNITVTDPPPPTETIYAADDFERSVSSGWGTAPTGGAWTITGNASSLRVAGGVGEVTLSPSSSRAMTLAAVSATSTDTEMTFALDSVPTGGGAYTNIVGRQVGTGNYAANVWIKSTGAVALVLKQGTTVLSNTVVPGLTYVAGMQLHVRLQVVGTAPTTVQARVWQATQTEPTTWLSSVTDATPALQSAGSVALQATLSASSTTGIVTRIDNFNARLPH